MASPLRALLHHLIPRPPAPPAAGGAPGPADPAAPPPAPHAPGPPRPLKYGWALAITGAVVAELFLACRLPVNPYLANFLAGAGLQRICDQPPANP